MLRVSSSTASKTNRSTHHRVLRVSTYRCSATADIARKAAAGNSYMNQFSNITKSGLKTSSAVATPAATREALSFKVRKWTLNAVSSPRM